MRRIKGTQPVLFLEIVLHCIEVLKARTEVFVYYPAIDNDGDVFRTQALGPVGHLSL